MQTYPSLTFAFPGEEFNAVRSNALVAVAQSAGESVPGLNPGQVFLNNEEIVPASVRFHEWNHGLSVMLPSPDCAPV
jgi:hypothetical protein